MSHCVTQAGLKFAGFLNVSLTSVSRHVQVYFWLLQQSPVILATTISTMIAASGFCLHLMFLQAPITHPDHSLELKSTGQALRVANLMTWTQFPGPS